MGIADTTGELMRLATTYAGAGDKKGPGDIMKKVQRLHNVLLPIRMYPRDWKKKMSIMLQSLQKMEEVCYKLQIQGEEYPPHILRALINEQDKFRRESEFEVQGE